MYPLQLNLNLYKSWALHRLVKAIFLSTEILLQWVHWEKRKTAFKDY